jgi:hypothetical protein
VLLSRDILVDYAPISNQGGGSSCSAVQGERVPAAWALMFGVLGVMGLALRRRV